MKLYPYVHFDGQCRAAFEYYAALLGGRITIGLTYGESPVETHCPEEMKGRIMHTCLVAGDLVLMGSDYAGPGFEGVRGASVSLHVAEPAEAERIYAALAEGGAVRIAMHETFWAHRFAMLTDRFGIPWHVSCDKTP